MAKPLPFRTVTDDTYAAAFAAACTPRETGRGVLLSGACPRCGDLMGFPVPTRVFLRPVAAVQGSKTVQVMCTCGVSHPGTPSNDEGCGAYWNVNLSEPAP